MMKSKYFNYISRVVLLILVINLCLSSVVFSEKSLEQQEPPPIEGAKVISETPTSILGGREEVLSEGYSLTYSTEKLNLYAALSGSNHGAFVVENKSDGSLWYTNQPDSSMDEYAINMFELRSMLIIETYSEETAALVRYNSKGNSVEEGGLNILGLEKGLKFIFDFPELEITVPVTVLINEKGYLTVNINVSEIEERGSEKIFNVELLPFFMAGNKKDEGHMLVPDGSGAVMNFNNGKTLYAKYNQAVYGGDASDISPEQKAVFEQVHMPVMGIKKNHSGVFSVITKGAAQSTVSATVSEISSGYNAIWSSVKLRKTTSYSMDKGWQGSRTFFVYQENEPSLPEVELRYYFLDEDNSDLGGMAETYRNYLVSESEGANLSTASQPIVYIDYLGAVVRKKPVLGIPMDSTIEITTFNDANNITKKLIDEGVENLAVGYQNWNADSVSGKIVKGANPEGKLGGRKHFSSLSNYLKENNIAFYPNVDLHEFSNPSYPLQQYSYAVRNMNNEISKHFGYKLNTYNQDKTLKGWYTLSLNKLGKTSSDFLKSYSKLGLAGISLGNLSKSPSSDYSNRKKPIELWKGQEIYTALTKQTADKYDLVLSEANFPAALYAKHVINAPKSSAYDMCDYSVPFYQMTLSGITSYVGRAINLSSNTREAFLNAISTGSGLHYSLSSNSEAANVKGTRFNGWIGTDYNAWLDTIKSQSAEMKSVYSKLGGSTLKSYEISDEGLVICGFNQGELVVNFQENTKTFNGIDVKGESYLIVKGGAVVG